MIIYIGIQFHHFMFHDVFQFHQHDPNPTNPPVSRRALSLQAQPPSPPPPRRHRPSPQRPPPRQQPQRASAACATALCFRVPMSYTKK